MQSNRARKFLNLLNDNVNNTNDTVNNNTGIGDIMQNRDEDGKLSLFMCTSVILLFLFDNCCSRRLVRRILIQLQLYQYTANKLYKEDT